MFGAFFPDSKIGESETLESKASTAVNCLQNISFSWELKLFEMEEREREVGA